MSDFKLVNIVDSQLEDITSNVTLPVITGAQDNTYQTFNAQATSGNTQIQYNITVPSLSTGVSRNVLIQADITLEIDIVGGTTPAYWDGGATLFKYGYSNALQAFPLNSLFQTVQSAINNANVSVSTRDVLPGLLKMYSYEELSKYNTLSPSLIDSFYLNYTDGVGSNNNVLGNYSIGTFSKEFQPRGVFLVSMKGLDATSTIVDAPLMVTASATGASPYSKLYLKFTTCEPLLFLSPYISGNSSNQACFLGINNMTITCNLSTANRAMSNASFALTGAGAPGGANQTIATISSVSLQQYENAKVLMNFLTIPPTLYSKILPKNVTNYNQYYAYKMNGTTGIPSDSNTNGNISFNSIQLSQIPSKILIYAMKDQGSMNTYDANAFLVIESISINFANQSGLLSSATPQQLYNMSVRNGLQMSYYEFSGKGISNTSAGPLAGTPVVIPTIGSILVIDPAMDLGLNPQYTNMSNGQFSVQFNINLRNQQTKANQPDVKPTIYMVCVNSGIFLTESGTCTQSMGVLNQEMVLETKSHDAVMDQQSYEKTVIGGSIENIGSLQKHMKMHFHKATEHEHNLDNGSGEQVHNAGAMSAGMIHEHRGLPSRRLHKYLQ